MTEEALKDPKDWYAISCPTTGLRCDARMLAFLDTDRDGHIRTPEILAAIAFLKGRGVGVEALEKPDPEDEKRLAEVLAREADLAKVEPSAAEKAARMAWEAKGREAGVAVLGAGTAEAEQALAAVEKLIDDYFTPPDDMPLVTEGADIELPLRTRLNPRHLESILRFADLCVTPLLGPHDTLTRLDWKAVKAKFAPYRAWRDAAPVMCADAREKLEEEEKFLRYKMHLGAFLANYVTMDALYAPGGRAIFQTGVLRIDGREMNLCFHVESESAHAALAEKSQCCVIYLRITRPAEKAERTICAVVTAGTVGTLYAGRNGVFYDYDGKDWEATVMKVVENQVSLGEAFWAPWRKVGAGVSDAVKKFIGDRQAKALTAVQAGAQNAQAGGAALASSVAAIGIGVGMVGAACASVMAAVSSMTPAQIALGVVALVMAVSLPSVILTWTKLRRRDLGAILNASGWAVNREMRFSMARAAGFTKCAKGNGRMVALLVLLAFAALLGAAAAARAHCPGACGKQPCAQQKCQQQQEATQK